jgi:hypothetical protein
MRNSSCFSVVIVLMCFAVPMAHAGYRFTTGAEYTRGDYGTGVETSSWYIPFSLGYSAGEYALSVTVPYVSVSGSPEVSGGGSVSVSGRGRGTHTSQLTTSGTERNDAGLGDVLFSASYRLQQQTHERPLVTLTGKVTLGTADEDKNLGSGANDYAVQLEMAKGPVDGYIGYLMLGDTTAVNYKDIYYGAIAYSVTMSQIWQMRTEYYTEQEVVSGVEPEREFTIAFSRPLSPMRNIKLYLIKGLSDSSPDWGAGVMVSSQF